LIVAGTQDVLVIPKNAIYMKDRIPGAQLALVENGGHGLMFQDPAWFSKLLTDFLE
jgi:pimeloyl-ACP methyl ester carboxylesterase